MPAQAEVDAAVIRYLYRLPTRPTACVEVEYRVFGEGMIETTLIYEPVPELGDIPEFGMIFKLDADLDRVSWYGNGPAETYRDRKAGAKLGLYSNRVGENLAAYTSVEVWMGGRVQVCLLSYISTLIQRGTYPPKWVYVLLSEYLIVCLSGDLFPHGLISISAFSRKQAKACMRLSSHICRTIKQKMK